jgi:hypothetical protein
MAYGNEHMFRSGQVRFEKKTSSYPGPRPPTRVLLLFMRLPSPGLRTLAEPLNLKSRPGPPPRPGQQPNLKGPYAAGAAGLDLKTKNQEPQRAVREARGSESLRQVGGHSARPMRTNAESRA